MRIWIGNDHGGLDMKRSIVALLKELDHEVHDVGSHTTEIVR